MPFEVHLHMPCITTLCNGLEQLYKSQSECMCVCLPCSCTKIWRTQPTRTSGVKAQLQARARMLSADFAETSTQTPTDGCTIHVYRGLRYTSFLAPVMLGCT